MAHSGVRFCTHRVLILSRSHPPGRVPRLARLTALAIRLDGLMRRGEAAYYADIASLGRTRARVTQIMNLPCLAPDIQEDILFLPRTERGRDPVREHHVRPIAAVPDWKKQRKMWGNPIAKLDSVGITTSPHTVQMTRNRHVTLVTPATGPNDSAAAPVPTASAWQSQQR